MNYHHNANLSVENHHFDENELLLEGDDWSGENLNYDGTKVDEEVAKCLLCLWRLRALKAARAHYKQSLHLKTWDFAVIAVNAIFSILILFITNSQWVGDGLSRIDIPYIKTGLDGAEVGLSMIALCLVMMTILQYIVGWGAKSEHHRAVGGQFADLQRRAERYLIAEITNMAMIHNVNRIYSQISRSSSLIPKKNWHSAGEDSEKIQDKNAKSINDRISNLEQIFDRKPPDIAAGAKPSSG